MIPFPDPTTCRSSTNVIYFVDGNAQSCVRSMRTVNRRRRKAAFATRMVFTFFVICSNIVRLFGHETHVFCHENVLGTRFELRLHCDSKSEAERAESIAMQEIDRLDAVYSSYNTNSDLRCWMDRESAGFFSVEMGYLLARSEYWMERTHRAFHPGVELVSRIWKRAEEQQVLPPPSELTAAARQLDQVGWVWSLDQSKAQAKLPLNFNAIAKGMIIDAVCEKLLHQPKIQGGWIAIGGDMRSFGDYTASVHVLHPGDDLLARTLSTVALQNRGLATSSGVHRGFTVQGNRYSHILDPRTGYPVSHVMQVSVIASSTADADAMATACSVMSVSESLKLIESTQDGACMILDKEGVAHTSSKWNRYATSPRLASLQDAEPNWNEGMEMKIDFSIHQPENTRRYRRPYIAIWIEDRDGKPVRTLLLWIHNTGHGQRWLPELSRWYRNDTVRMKKEDLDLVKEISEATRRPGAYSITWNGLDDHKRLVTNGDYTLCIEAAREHGSHQLIRKKISVGDQPFQLRLEDNPEIDNAMVNYQKKQAKNGVK